MADDSYYLLDNKPKQRQYRTQRRGKVNGNIVLHTPEGGTDLIGPDTKAENVANFIRNRTGYGSYHRITDRDSIVKMMPFSYEAYHDGTRINGNIRSNSVSIGISVALNAADWPKLAANQRDEYLLNLVVACVEAADWLKEEHNITVPATRLTKVESNAGKPGFISHGDRDPGRRTDPGPRFPWALFLNMFDDATNGAVTVTAPPPVKGRQVATHPKGGAGGLIINDCLNEIDAITLAVRGQRLSDAEFESWARDLVTKVYVEGHQDLSGVTRWVHYALSAG